MKQRLLSLFLVGAVLGLTGCSRFGSSMAALGLVRPQAAVAMGKPIPADAAPPVLAESYSAPQRLNVDAGLSTGGLKSPGQKTSVVAPRAALEPGVPVPASARRPQVVVERMKQAKREPEVAPLDFERLEARLHETPAMGLMTKLTLKNQMDDLVRAFAAYHKGETAVGLYGLHERFSLLLMKVVLLLQDEEPKLTADIDRSRDGLWRALADPDRFSHL